MRLTQASLLGFFVIASVSLYSWLQVGVKSSVVLVTGAGVSLERLFDGLAHHPGAAPIGSVQIASIGPGNSGRAAAAAAFFGSDSPQIVQTAGLCLGNYAMTITHDCYVKGQVCSWTQCFHGYGSNWGQGCPSEPEWPDCDQGQLNCPRNPTCPAS